ncbi:hypothetical protein CFOL_v3_35732, partial [Cephalotus follicularis]
ETLDHLFFACAYTQTVWGKVMELNNCLALVDWNWDTTATWVLGHTVGSRFHRWMRRDGLGAAVYHCWRERNNRIFRQMAAPTSHLLARIIFDVAKKATLHLSIQDTPNRALVENWEIEETIFCHNGQLPGTRQGAARFGHISTTMH